jgi:hypothetical protein
VSAPEDLVDEYFERLISGQDRAPKDMPSERIDVMRSLFAERIPLPTNSFLDGLEQHIRSASSSSQLRSASPATAGKFGPVPSLRGGAKLSVNIKGSLGAGGRFTQALASVLILIVIAGLATIAISNSRESDPKRVAQGISVPATPSPQTGCPYSETAFISRLTSAKTTFIDRYSPLLIAQIPGIFRWNEAINGNIMVIPESALSNDPVPSLEIRQAIEEAIQLDIACRNTFFAEDGPADQADLLPGVSSPKLVVGYPPYVFPTPEILSMTMLDDGRVGVMVTDDPRQPEVHRYLVMAPFADEWIVDEASLVATDDWISARSNGVLTRRLTIDIYDYDFLASSIDIPAERSIDVTINNQSTHERHFMIEGLGINLVLAPGESSTIQINVALGGCLFVIDFDDPRSPSRGGWLWAHEPLASDP